MNSGESSARVSRFSFLKEFSINYLSTQNTTMKKLIFALLALFMVSAVVVSCDNKKSKKDKEAVD